MSEKFEIKNNNYSILLLKGILVTQKAIKDFKVLIQLDAAYDLNVSLFPSKAHVTRKDRMSLNKVKEL